MDKGIKNEIVNRNEKVVLMWGYLPGVSVQRSPVFSPTAVCMPESMSDDSWKDVCGGGCGFAMATSESGKLLTWGSTDDMGQSYVAAGKHEEIPEPFPLPTEAAIVNAAAGWAHCAAVTDSGEVYAWGWKECVPTGTGFGDAETENKQNGASNQASSRLMGNNSRTLPCHEIIKAEEGTKRRRLSSAKQDLDSSNSSDETLSYPPCLVMFNQGVKIASVAAGGRHTLALSDVGEVWGWGYGGEGQLGLGSRVRMVSSPIQVPCIESAAYGKDRLSKITANSGDLSNKVVGNCVKSIACGGRHSAAITDAGAILTFGWGLYGQCGQGSTDDEMSPKCVSSLLGVKMQGVATGLWHTVCISDAGDVYSFGGNQFGQLGTASDHAETVPKLLEEQCLENKKAKVVSCGARHSTVITDDGEAFCWGWNKYGQLGLGDAVDRSTPVQVPIESYRLTNISCGWWHTLAHAESPT